MSWGSPPARRAPACATRRALALDLTSGIRGDAEPIATGAASARTRTGERVTELTGARVGEIRLRITHLVTEERSGS
ncbi:hypothetical protein [Microbacterium hominis]|uniref:hypothetical protein n=1 Tax=Microbacterium hominis TaxID=162426 RepID=UPI00076866EB|nr:hypothetical protein [Microbacterium hominis]KXC04740.1 hypothetical protein MhomT_15595 [Microbacterium hominis]